MENNAKTSTKSKLKLLTLIPKAATSFGFQNPQFSPSREKQRGNQELKNHMNKGFSGPISLIPQEARNKSKNSAREFDSHEPTSPRISCMGQIKHRKKMNKKKNAPSHKDMSKNQESASSPALKKKISSGGFLGLFVNAKSGKKLDAFADEKPKEMTKLAPNLGHMRRFASGRESTLGNFDWTKAQIAPGDYSDEENRGEEEDEDEDEVIIPFSAPIPRGGGEVSIPRRPLEPKKEINLWKRRTMVQPRPLDMVTPN